MKKMKKMKKKLILVAVIIFVLFTAFIIAINLKNNEKIDYDSKMNLLHEKFMQNSNISKINNKPVILSISDQKKAAVVTWSNEQNVEVAYKDVREKIKKYVKENNYDVKWIKLDIVNNTKKVSKEELQTYFNSIQHKYTFRYGIIIDGIVLTEAQLNANRIIDYKNKSLNLDRINAYLNQEKFKEIPNEVELFTTFSYFVDENNKVYELYNSGSNTGRRINEKIQKNDITEIVQNGTKYLTQMVTDTGKFIYGYYPLTNKEIDDYNILRHAGSVWSLIVCYDQYGNKSKIDKALEYLNTQVAKKDENTYFIIEEKSDEIKLGGNALSAIAMCEYISKFNDTKYLETIEKLGNGIISMQESDGGFNHVLNTSDYSLKEKTRTVYYDGEATFALGKIYGITKDEKYLEAAKKAINYFIDNDYTKYGDHWISYATNEITKYVDDESYYEFGLKNIANNIDTIRNKQFTSHINLEMLVQCLELYNKIKDKNIEVKYMEEFPIHKLKQTLDERAKFQLNSYMYPEMVMYLKNPKKYYNTFFIRQNDFRIRIDDIQHSILGYHYYTENFQQIYN